MRTTIDPPNCELLLRDIDGKNSSNAVHARATEFGTPVDQLRTSTTGRTQKCQNSLNPKEM